MKNKNLFDAITEFAEEKKFTKEEVMSAIEKGIVNAYKKERNVANLKVKFNEETSEILFYEYFNVVEERPEGCDDPSVVTVEEIKQIKKDKKVSKWIQVDCVDGQAMESMISGDAKAGTEVRVKVAFNPKDVNRIVANSVKQILNQEVKRIEREKAYNYFIQKEGEMIDGRVVSVNENNVTFDIGNDITSNVSKSELSKDEMRIGVMVKLYVSKVYQDTKGPKVVVSKSDKNIIKRLFEEMIPEIKDGTIEIKGIARDTGDRSKVCVKSNNPDVDALGSCLGPKGRRIKDIIDALGGEKIDVYEYSDDPTTLVKNSLQPAEVFKVIFDQQNKSAKVVVPDDMFSLAIGKKGQNVRLAVQSSGWKIDIKNVTEASEEGIEF